MSQRRRKESTKGGLSMSTPPPPSLGTHCELNQIEWFAFHTEEPFWQVYRYDLLLLSSSSKVYPPQTLFQIFCLYLFFYSCIHTPFLAAEACACRVKVIFTAMRFFYIIVLSFVTAKRSSGLRKRGIYVLPGEMNEQVDQKRQIDDIPRPADIDNTRGETEKELILVDEAPLPIITKLPTSTRGVTADTLTPVDETSLSAIRATFVLAVQPSTGPSFTIPISFITRSEFPKLTTTPSQASFPASAYTSTLSTGAKVGIGIGAFLGLIILILPSILLWRSKRKNRRSRKKATSTPDDRFAKAELDADESQRSDHRTRELPGDLAHELPGNSEEGNETWELPGDMAFELTGGGDAHEIEAKTAARELPGDMTYDLKGQ